MSRKLFLEIVENIKSYIVDPLSKHFKFFSVGPDRRCYGSNEYECYYEMHIRHKPIGICDEVKSVTLLGGHLSSKS